MRINNAADLTHFIITILKDLNLYTRMNYLINSYIHRVGITKVNEVKATKARVTGSLGKPGLSWVLFKYILLDVLHPKGVTITIELEFDHRENTLHTFHIDNSDEKEDKDGI